MAKDFYTATLAGGTVPASTTTTATAALTNTSTTVVGTGMDALSIGDWIVDIANQERRMVTAVHDATKVTISSPFSNATASAVLDIVKAEACNAVYMQLSGSGIVVDGVTTDSVEFGNSNSGGDTAKLIRPRFVTGDVTVNIEYFNNTYAD